MNSSADIIVSRIPDAISIPAKGLFTDKGRPIVYLQTKTGYEARVVWSKRAILTTSPSRGSTAASWHWSGLLGDAGKAGDQPACAKRSQTVSAPTITPVTPVAMESTSTGPRKWLRHAIRIC